MPGNDDRPVNARKQATDLITLCGDAQSAASVAATILFLSRSTSQTCVNAAFSSDNPCWDVVEDDPGAGLLNLFDVWIAFAVALLLAMISYYGKTSTENAASQAQLEAAAQ